MFTTIIIFNRVGGHEIAREKCKQKIIEENPEDAIADQDSVLCETCGCGDRSDVLLLCDGKLVGFFHTIAMSQKLYGKCPNIFEKLH